MTRFPPTVGMTAVFLMAGLGSGISHLGWLPGHEQEPAQDDVPLFASDELLEFSLAMDLNTVIRDTDSLEREQHPAVLTYTDESGAEIRVPLKVRTRGHFRRQRRNCRFPPLRLNFAEDSVVGTVFAGQDKVKLTTHCQDRDEYEQYVVQEYLVNKTHSVLNARSLQVRLARISYVDTAEREEPKTKLAMLMEDDEAFAKRLGAELVETEGVHPLETEMEQMLFVGLFEYMIGNTDWGVPALHNIILLEKDFAYYAVPYDFDCVGAVDARYASKCAGLLCANQTDRRYPCIRNPRQRMYRGFCRQGDFQGDLQMMADLFDEKRDEIYQLYNDTELLEPKRLEKAIKYYDEFYETINDSGKMRSRIVRNCRS